MIRRRSWTYTGPTQRLNGTWSLEPLSCTAGVVGEFHVYIGQVWDCSVDPPVLDTSVTGYAGVDITYVSGVRSLIRSMTWGEPYGEIDAAIDLPRVRVYDAPAWLAEGANVDIYRVVTVDDVEVEVPHWHGFVASDPVADAATVQVGVSLRCLGAMFGEIGQRVHQPVMKSASRDVGTILGHALYPADYSRPFNDYRFRFEAATTGIEIRRRGSRGQMVVDHVDEILGLAQDDTSQWTISRAFGVDGFPQARKYYLRRKPTGWATAVQASTVTAGGYGIDLSGLRDLTTTPNAVYGEGINPLVDGKGGDRYRNAKFPADFPTKPAYPDRVAGSTYPVTMGDVDADFMSPVVTQLQYALRMGTYPDVEITGEFDVDTATALIALQTDADVTVTGEVGSDADWDLVFATSAANADIGSGYFRPFSEVAESAQYLYAANGAVMGPNPVFDGRIRVERMLSHGESRFKDARAFSRRLARQSLGGVPFVGSVRMTSDPQELSRFLLREGGWCRIRGPRNGNDDVYVAAVQQEPESPGSPVTVTCAARAWDLLELRARNERDYEALKSPVAAFAGLRNQTTNPFKSAVGWDKESGAGLIREFDHPGGEWVVVKVRADQQGLIQSARITTRDDPCDHAFAVFGKAITAAGLAAIVADPFADVADYGSPFNDPANDSALQAAGFINAWGQPGSPGGRSPGAGTDAPVTGDSIDEMNWPFVSWDPPDLWVGFYAVSACTIRGRFKIQFTDEG